MITAPTVRTFTSDVIGRQRLLDNHWPLVAESAMSRFAFVNMSFRAATPPVADRKLYRGNSLITTWREHSRNNNSAWRGETLIFAQKLRINLNLRYPVEGFEHIMAYSFTPENRRTLGRRFKFATQHALSDL